MSRRGAPPNQSLFGPPQSSHRAIHDPNESAFSTFMREEVWAPEKLPGNISILTGVAVFVAGIVSVRLWGEVMIPA
ncbi:hypothetical protein SISNIDRAFT_515872 [Sistotremastrum niveocremeum HHB9708]|uniref:Uncharacterized protein n=2 Tax=Sistotremastraceae TaxID=3402574 RepID=A0A164SU70_9AGAM|nr:hypothetical protein SISNIDRAFT_515872 [Sistotremastrum niveocremeum HHB9708]KZT40386.1 hypothetical protein SISSUDRAFT_1044286 [Sistotremastrum suecicum HHB10207 ss-3]